MATDMDLKLCSQGRPSLSSSGNATLSHGAKPHPISVIPLIWSLLCNWGYTIPKGLSSVTQTSLHRAKSKVFSMTFPIQQFPDCQTNNTCKTIAYYMILLWAQSVAFDFYGTRLPFTDCQEILSKKFWQWDWFFSLLHSISYLYSTNISWSDKDNISLQWYFLQLIIRDLPVQENQKSIDFF